MPHREISLKDFTGNKEAKQLTRASSELRDKLGVKNFQGVFAGGIVIVSGISLDSQLYVRKKRKPREHDYSGVPEELKPSISKLVEKYNLTKEHFAKLTKQVKLLHAQMTEIQDLISELDRFSESMRKNTDLQNAYNRFQKLYSQLSQLLDAEDFSALDQGTFKELCDQLQDISDQTSCVRIDLMKSR